MVVLIIALVIGLIIFFLGLSLLIIYKNEEEKGLEEQTNEQDERKELSDDELKEAFKAPSKSYIFSLILGGEGILLAVLAVTSMFIHGLVAKIPFYISLPILLVYLLGCFVYNALKMYKE